MELIAKEYQGDSEASSEGSEPDRPSVSYSSPQEVISTAVTPSTGGYVSTRKRKTIGATATTSFNAPSSFTTASKATTSMDSVANSSSISSFIKGSTGLWSSSHQDNPLVWRGHDKPVLSLDWHSFHPSLLLSSSLDGTVKVWDSSCKSHCLASLIATTPVQAAKWMHDSNHSLSGGQDKAVNETDMERMITIHTIRLDGILTALALHPTDPNVFVTGDSCKMVKSWDIRTKKSTNSFVGSGGQILDITFINGGNELVASSDIVRKNAASQMLLVWDCSFSVAKSSQIYCEPYTCPCVMSHPFEDQFMAQSNADYIVIFSSKSPYRMNKRKRYDHHSVNGYKTQFDIDCNGQYLVSGSSDGGLYVYDCHTTRLRKRHSFSIPSIAIQCHPTVPSSVACSLWDGSIVMLNI